MAFSLPNGLRSWEEFGAEGHFWQLTTRCSGGGQRPSLALARPRMILNDLNGAERWNDWNALNERFSSVYKSASAGITLFPINSIGVIC